MSTSNPILVTGAAGRVGGAGADGGGGVADAADGVGADMGALRSKSCNLV